MDTNYFACTLGQAAILHDGTKPHRTISEFLSHQGKHHGDVPAIGFPLPRREEVWDYKVLNFRDVKTGTQIFAQRLSTSFELDTHNSRTVALLSHSSPEFLFTWLGLIWLGYSVLLIAPQCQPAAIEHLCKSCNISLLLHDPAHSERVINVLEICQDKGTPDLLRGQIPLEAEEDIFQVIQGPSPVPVEYAETNETDVAYLHHTSGTSSGLPKPIAQTHGAAVGFLPHLPTTPTKATFTTTPLYHGGIADVFRSWTSDSIIWLFPGKDIPITARNICKCLDLAELYSSTEGHPMVKYSSSVPYVLQMMGADDKGLTALQRMDVMGVGGAALPAEVGNRLLISRFGSAECGFLLSSYRDFAADKEWQYLRNYSPAELVEFEPRDDGLGELVAKKNRDDGSFATADLFLYHSRADAQLTLITGKKFDPAPLEAAIATSQFLDDVLIFGNSRPYPGALLLRSEVSKDMTGNELVGLIWPLVQKTNNESQDHARISRNMLIPVPFQLETLEKRSKGTIIRRVAERRFTELIDAAYGPAYDMKADNIEDGQITQHLISLIEQIVPHSTPLEEDTDLFSHGVDSIVCMRLRNYLQQLVPRQEQTLPLSIIEDSGTIRGLSDDILRRRHGKPEAQDKDENKHMLDLVQQYSSFDDSRSVLLSPLEYHYMNGDLGEVIVLTGATGALGAHILNLLRDSDSVSTVYCLVRGSNKNAAKERITKALEQRGLGGIAAGDKVTVVQAQLGEPRLGLSDSLYSYLAARTDLVLHVAWTVNFRLKLQSFEKDNIAGVTNLINLALAAGRSRPPRFAYCSSTAAIMNRKADQGGRLAETISQDPSTASPLGYSRSKWVAEQICLEANERTQLHGRVAIIRVGQLSGDSITGSWNTKEAWPMMLSTSRLIGCLPDLGDEPLGWLPVDIAANAFLEAAKAQSKDHQSLSIYHVLSPHPKPTWHQMLHWLKKKENFDIVPSNDWVGHLEQSNGTDHPAMKLLGMWKESYSTITQQSAKGPEFSISLTQEKVPALRNIQPLDEAYVGKVWEWAQANIK
ncbi:hypothetical protein CC80DRAFT_517873 [Byssothecium circinans]|uniref:Carrier domain-containing protein n=1 Tax=Byssothecium circinans TaxID=147558 RepID=A0A6A5TMH8_9PLEO|nr:hypothetical protein CC80DRAFT_517873 [Byssothecium circinans]